MKFILGSLSLLSLALADLTCTQWIPYLHHSNIGVINFYGINSYSYIPSGNLSTGNPAQIDFTSPVGKRFHFEECNSTSLNLTSQLRINGNCSESCARQHTKFIRVLDPHSGHCLTARNLSASLGEMYFHRCNPDPLDHAQLWQVEQDVLVGIVRGKPHAESAPLYFMTVYSNPEGYQYEPGDDSPWLVLNGSNTVFYRAPDQVDSVSCYIFITGM